jgi:HprK-related kinase A
VTLGDVSEADLRRRLNGEGLVLRIGPFSFRIVSPIDEVASGLAVLYPDYPLLDGDSFADFTVEIAPGRGLRRWFKRQAVFRFDGSEPFVPLPQDHAMPLLEWSMNWCIAVHAHQYLLLHSAVIERNGYAVIMPAPPGSGKSTLCAGLIHRGWRLLSDEVALISLAGESIAALGRPVSLKNQSIDIIRRYAQGSVFSRVVHDTAKGSVSLLRVPQQHLARLGEPARPRWVVFPKYVAGAPARLSARSKANSMLELGRNAFNYMVLGRTGFEVLAKVIDGCDCYDFEYSQLDDAVAVFDQLAEGARANTAVRSVEVSL